MSDGSGSSGPKPGVVAQRDEKDIKFREQSDSNAKVLRYVTDFLMNHSGKWIGLDKLNHNPKLVGFIGHLLVGLPGIHRTMTVRAADGTEKEIGYLGTEWIAQTFNIRDWGGIPMVPREIITVTKDPAGEVLVKLTSNWTTTRTGSKLIVDPNASAPDSSRGHGYHYGKGGRGGHKGGAWWKGSGGGGKSAWKGGGGRNRQYNYGGYYGNGSRQYEDEQWWDQQQQHSDDKRISSSSYRYGGRGGGFNSDEESRVKHESPAVDWDDETPVKEGDGASLEADRGDPEPKRQRVKSPSTHRRSSPKSRGKSPDSRRGRDRRSYNASVERDRSRRRNRGSASIGRVKDEEDDQNPGRSKSRGDRRGYPGPRSRSSSESSVELSDAESWPEDPTDDRENRNNSVDTPASAMQPLPDSLREAKVIADDLQLFELGSERKQRDMRDMLREMIRDIYQIYRPEKSSHVHSRLFRKFSGREDLLYLLVANRYIGRPTYHERRRRRIKYRPRHEPKALKSAGIVSANSSRSSSRTPTASQRNGVGREASGLDMGAPPAKAVGAEESPAVLPPVLPLNMRVTPDIIKFLTKTRSWLQRAVESLVPKIVLFDEANAHPLDIRVLHVLTNCCMIKFRPERAPHKVIGCLAGYERCIPTNLPQGTSVTNMSIPKVNALLLKTIMRDPITGQINNGDLAFRAVSNEPASEEELEAAAMNWQSISGTVNTMIEDVRRCERALKLIHQRQAPLSKESVRRIVLNGEMLTVDTLPPNEGLRPPGMTSRHHRPPDPQRSAAAR